MIFISAFLSAAILGMIATIAVRQLAHKINLVDQPDMDRKIHAKPMPLMGGLAVFAAFILVVGYYAFFTDQLIAGYLRPVQLMGMVIGGAILMIGGYYDDRLRLKPSKSIIAPMVAAAVAICFGLVISGLTNPFGGGTIHFDYTVKELSGPLIYILVKSLAVAATFIWLMGMMYTTKYLDGLDGLASGVGLIAALVIALVAVGPTLQQDYIALLALIFAGALAGFLIFNFNPASIFLGEGGSLLIGFVLGSLAIVSGSKIATTLLVMGIPILDVVWVIGRRLFSGKKLVTGDKLHLHHRLLAVGLSHRGAVLVLYLLTMMFGATAVFLQTYYKLYALLSLAVFMVSFGLVLVYLYRRRIKK